MKNNSNLESKGIIQERIKVAFLNVGGTWNMVKKGGKLTGSGGLDDENLYKLEESLGFYKKNRKALSSLELKLTKEIGKNIITNNKQQVNLVEYLSWVPNISKHVTGKFISLYNGDSSHLRPALIAPVVAFILKEANDNPTVQILSVQGTDTADIALLPLLDAYTFDTGLLPILFTGSNRSYKEWNSDAPKNFSNMVQLAGANLPAGVYWIFSEHLYRATDFIKIDPLETRRIENYSTFFSPRQTARYIKKVISENHILYPSSGTSATKNHVSRKVNTENLYKAIVESAIVDLGNQNDTFLDVDHILDDKYKAIIIAAHSLGNTDNIIRHACIQAALEDKLVIIVSRSPIGEVTERYATSLLGVNGKELLGTGKYILSGHKMNPNVAKAIATRAIQENLDQKQTQILINTYCDSRGLLV